MDNQYLVKKANALITSHYELTEIEQKIILVLASLVQPEDEEFKPYDLAVSDFLNVLGVKDRSKYTELPKITKGLMKKVFEINEDKRMIQVAWLSSVIYNKGTGIITLEFSPQLKPYMLGLKEYFTKYRLSNVLGLTGKYTIRLYEILKSNEFKKTFTMEITEFFNTLKLTKTYLNFNHIRVKILEPAKRQLAEKSDIVFIYETITQRKKVISLRFTVMPNPKNRKDAELPGQLELVGQSGKTQESDDIKSFQKFFLDVHHVNFDSKFARILLKDFSLRELKEKILELELVTVTYDKPIEDISKFFFNFVAKGFPSK